MTKVIKQSHIEVKADSNDCCIEVTEAVRTYVFERFTFLIVGYLQFVDSQTWYPFSSSSEINLWETRKHLLLFKHDFVAYQWLNVTTLNRSGHCWCAQKASSKGP